MASLLRRENLFFKSGKKNCHLNLEQDLDSLERRDDRLADGRGDAAGHEVQQEVVVHGAADQTWRVSSTLK